MTRTRLLSTAAVALAFGVAALSAASAQTKPNPEPAPAAQQNAPPSRIAPPINAGEHKSAGAGNDRPRRSSRRSRATSRPRKNPTPS